MGKFAHDTVVPFDESELSKKEQVSEMFNQISGRYDLLNRLLSGGTDVKWRKKALKEINNARDGNILDVATGTADLAIMANSMLEPKKVTGIDISEGMLDIGREKIRKLKMEDKIELLKGDSEAINAPENSFDAVTVAFGVRNFQDLEKGLSEMRRVLKPGGKIMVLEFSKPSHPLFKPFYTAYMKLIAPWLGKLFSGNKKAYSYLDQSIKKFPEGKHFLEILSRAGFNETYSKQLSLGICSIYCGKK